MPTASLHGPDCRLTAARPADAAADLLALIGFSNVDLGAAAIDMLPGCSPVEFTLESRLMPLIDSIGGSAPVHVKPIEPEQWKSSLHIEPGPPLQLVRAGD